MNYLEIHFLGTRGTIPIDAKEYEIFGGATACTLIKYNKQNLILDAGTGLLSLDHYIDCTEEQELSILISHPHIDHIIGLLASRILFNPKLTINIYGKPKDGRSIKEQIHTMMREPIWPVNSDVYTAQVNFIDITENFSIGEFHIIIEESYHAGGSTIYRIECNDKKIIYSTDYEIDENSRKFLVEFSRNVDFMICDGQFSDTYKEFKKGFGHSSWQDAIQVASEAGCKQMCIFHHDPYSTDDYLLTVEEQVKHINSNYFLARKGGCIRL